MQFFTTLEHWLGRLYVGCGYAAAACLVLLAGLVIASIVSRLVSVYVPGLVEFSGYAMAGASFLATPAAFTKTTGEAHWHVLQRARAIETGSYVLAPCQCGEHAGGRKTYGHSLIVDPWGRVLADGGEQPGYVLAEVEPAQVHEARQMIPSLRHDRGFAEPSALPRAVGGL